MTEDDCAKILMTIDACYPNFNVNNDSIEYTKKAWNVFLKDFEYKEIETALRIYIMTSGSAFAPSVSELIAAARKPKQLTEIGAEEAWPQVRKAIRNSLYNSEEGFAALPELAQKVVGSPNQLRTWGMMESREIDTVIWSNFKKSYEALQKRTNDYAALPKDVQQLLDNTSKNMIGAAL